MKTDELQRDAEDAREQPLPDPKQEPTEEPEFKVTVRKLEVPVRPRGVLAE
jgi:hypothetical protein